MCDCLCQLLDAGYLPRLTAVYNADARPLNYPNQHGQAMFFNRLHSYSGEQGYALTQQTCHAFKEGTALNTLCAGKFESTQLIKEVNEQGRQGQGRTAIPMQKERCKVFVRSCSGKHIQEQVPLTSVSKKRRNVLFFLMLFLRTYTATPRAMMTITKTLPINPAAIRGVLKDTRNKHIIAHCMSIQLLAYDKNF